MKNNNYAEFFPILRYKNGVLSRVNGSGQIIGGDYALLPLFSVDQQSFCRIEVDRFRINGKDINIKRHCITANIEDLPDPCFLVAHRFAGGYTTEELDRINQIWSNLMLEIENEY